MGFFIGAGTGLGQATLIPLEKGGYTALAAEGGHASFPFESAAEVKYMHYLLKETGEPYIRTETVVSGGGLSRLHHFLTGERLEPAEVAGRLTDESGKRYLDCLTGLAVVSVGHANPRVTAAVTEQMNRLVHVSNLY